MTKLQSRWAHRLPKVLAFGRTLDDAEWVRTMKGADVALVTLKRGAEGLVIPSKVYSALVAGQAIIAVCARDSDLGELVCRHDAGWVVEPGDGVQLKAVLDEITHRPDEVRRKRINARIAGVRHYSQRTLAAEWSAVLESSLRHHEEINQQWR